jgi:HD-GYP domain-containing protein (c-di-GMP phosphodiesterase class II)
MSGGINENLMVPVSVNLLYDGMVVQDDIYDADGDRLLMRAGNVISDLQIERIGNLNSGRSTIYVTGRTHKAMVSKRPNIEIDNRVEIEESSGYAEIKNETFDVLEELATKNIVNQESLLSVSDNLSECLESTPPTVILSLINAMAPFDEYLQRHSVNVSLLNGMIGRWMELSKTEVDKLVLIGLMHDCGKTLLPPSVLNAPRRLTGVEFEVIKMHAVYTYDLLSEFPEDVRVAASSHHERVKGGGYPKGLSKDEITQGARITAVSDIYDAMVSRRSYKKPNSPFRILAMLNKLSWTDIDGNIVNILKENMPKELMDKPVMMSDGTIGIVREFDVEDIEYPTVEHGGRTFKTSEKLYCESMYNDE